MVPVRRIFDGIMAAAAGKYNRGAEWTRYGLYGRMTPQAIMAPEFPEG